MRITRKAVSLILALVMVLGLLPAAAFASESNVYISVSYDGQYIDDKNGEPIAYIPVSFENLSSIGMKYGTGDIGGITFQVGSVNIQLSSLAIAAIVGITMNAILPGKDYEFGANEQGDISVNFGPRHKQFQK